MNVQGYWNVTTWTYAIAIIRTIFMAKTFGETFIDVYFELFLSILYPGPHGAKF